ncbi:MAG: hypothetical protein JO108_04240 [Acidobacteriaceae bacterium]|nr:hypothetical protein [Acidobacteriaceae bacterium]
MFPKAWWICVLLGGAVSFGFAADVPQPADKLTAAETVERNVVARGGLRAWRDVQTMSLTGKLTAGGNQRATIATTARRPGQATLSPRPAEEVQLPFVMELKRPRKMRFELRFNGQAAVQIYDGQNGWKLRPYLNRTTAEPYTDEELKISALQADLDGPLIDYAQKGTSIALDGQEKVEGRDTYKLKVAMKNGHVLHVWIDAQTFLEAKIEGAPRRLDGVPHPVEIYFRDYRAVDGLQIPFALETRVLPVPQIGRGSKVPLIPSERTTIEKVEINPKLAEAEFAKPEVQVASVTR